MCGILGYFSLNNHNINPENEKIFGQALHLIKHRGPDDVQICKLPFAWLGFSRLSIIGGNSSSQPLKNGTDSIYLICNGEIYNHQELKKSLKQTHQFNTSSDCEIIIHLYEEFGEKFVSKLKGQFAFCLYDDRKHRLICARDRFGILPLYYTRNSDNLVIASEIKALIPLSSWINQLDPQGLAESVILYGPSWPRTVVKDVFQIPPAHLMTINLLNGKFSLKKYWQPPSIKQVDFDSKRFKELLSRAVSRRLQGITENLGVYFSGGIDSSSIAVLAKELSKKPPILLSVQFNNQKFNEAAKQNTVSKFLGLKLFSTLGDSKDKENIFDQALWHLESPLTRLAPIPLYKLSALANNHRVKYVLCGEGADEMMFGYPIFFQGLSSVEAKFSQLKSFQKLFSPVFKLNFEIIFNNYLTTMKKKYRYANKNRFNQLVEIDTKLSRFLLSIQGDRMSMSHSVEQRFPFLDEDLVDYLFQTDPNTYMGTNCGKTILRKIMENCLPTNIIKNKKQGYLAPWQQLSQTLKNHKQLLTNAQNKYFNQNVVSKLYRRYQKGDKSESTCSQLLFVISTLLLNKQLFI